MIGATRFIRRRGEGVWHFCTNCLGYREALNRGLERRDDRPGDAYLCDGCATLEREGKCSR